MILEVLAVITLAKIKHYKIKYLFYTWTFYPILLAELAYIGLQITIFAGNYEFVQYTEFFRIAHSLSFLFAMFAFELYKPALIGSGSMMIGTLLNRFVISQNNGKMPVFPTLSYWTGYVKPDTFDIVNDIHVLGGIDTSWKILTDWIDVGYSIMSPGDVLIHVFAFLMLYALIKAVNKKYDPSCHINELS